METTTNKGQIFIIVCTIAFLAVTCVVTMCYLSYVGQEPSQALNLLTGGLVGSLTSMLVKTSPTETTKQPDGGFRVHSQEPLPPQNGGKPPTEVTVVNKPNDPVPTEERKT